MAGRVWKKETTVLLCYEISAIHGSFYLHNWLWIFFDFGIFAGGNNEL